MMNDSSSALALARAAYCQEDVTGNVGRLKGAVRSKSLRIAGALLLPEYKRKRRSLPEAKDAKGTALEANQRRGLWPSMAGALSEGFHELFHRWVLERPVREHPCSQGHNLTAVVSQPGNLSPLEQNPCATPNLHPVYP